ncbi:hypothetical protein LCGC14_1577060 [marine sediment metagenome]|uniref:Uncharacterized protein n=1 Tax=marine sediment metagenome TaxID=412755 RepID=A0A0F9KYZ6_9ZZZZ
MEKRSDLLLSTLRPYVKVVGGKLTLQVELPGHARVTLNGMGDTEEREVSTKGTQITAS